METRDERIARNAEIFVACVKDGRISIEWTGLSGYHAWEMLSDSVKAPKKKPARHGIEGCTCFQLADLCDACDPPNPEYEQMMREKYPHA